MFLSDSLLTTLSASNPIVRDLILLLIGLFGGFNIDGEIDAHPAKSRNDKMRILLANMRQERFINKLTNNY